MPLIFEQQRYIIYQIERINKKQFQKYFLVGKYSLI